MKRLKNELLLINILVILLIIAVTLFQSSVIRIIIGLPFLLFFPGYTLIAALFPRRNTLDSIERVALSFALSIAVVAAIGVILNYTTWGIRLYPVLFSLTIFILVTSITAWVRRLRLAEGERLALSLGMSLRLWKEQGRVPKILSLILVAVIMATVGTIGYVIATPGEEERFTEFYVLGLEGKAEGYPETLAVGETATVIIGITNHEKEDVTYRVEISIAGEKQNEIDRITVRQGEKWEREVFFTPVRAGENQKNGVRVIYR
ncbi:DUF1616 domain-containing protein [Chloroflexota bacterium]